MMKIPTYIVGTGGLGRGVLETVKLINSSNHNWDIAGFIDDNETMGSVVNGLSVKGNTNDLLHLKEVSNVVIAIANPNIKEKIYRKLLANPNLLYPNIIHPSVFVNRTVKIGYGNIISDHVAISANVEISNFTLVHFNSTIGHDIKIHDYSTIYPGANLSGFSVFHTKSQIGSNACVLPSVTIGAEAIVGAGAVVNKNVDANTTVAGVPAEILKK